MRVLKGISNSTPAQNLSQMVNGSDWRSLQDQYVRSIASKILHQSQSFASQFNGSELYDSPWYN